MSQTTAAYGAYIFDLDGVLTRTAEQHFAAWKGAFDAFLQQHSQRTAVMARPFELADYRRHVDGKPRYDGVRDFLRARGIELPWGSPQDAPQQETVCGLGNRKNALFQEQLQQRGVETYPAAVEFLHALKAAGARVAAVSSSKNAAAVLQGAGLATAFDTTVDGRLGEQLDLPGKPAPDYFLEAARRLQVAPQRCVVFEDAVSGVQAGRAGGFGLVVGIARESEPEALLEGGADVVVEDFTELDPSALPRRDLPLALEHLDEIREAIGQRRLGVFLDYDGTLTPIVPRPEDAVLAPRMRERVAHLAQSCPVAIVSGRDLQGVRELVGLPQLYYVGSHGFDIAGSAGDPLEHRPAEEFLPILDAAEAELRGPLEKIAGAQLERKRFSIAVHYRNVSRTDQPALEEAVREVARAHRELRRGAGKKVIELRPRVDWHKGKAVQWLRERLHLDTGDAQVLYIGDDVTDEDVFRALRGEGIGMLVAEGERASLATYRLRDTREVAQLLEELIRSLRKR